MLKLSDNPSMLFPHVASIRELAGKWWVAHTKARNEKAFARDLVGRDVPYYLPMIQRVTYTRGRKFRSLVPLFSSYVFVCGGEEERYRALTTNRLCQMIDVPDQHSLLQELASVERAIAGEVKLDPYPFAAVGRRCRVARGPFMGIEGIVVSRKDNTSQLVLQVSLLGRGAAMEIDASLLESID